MSELTVEIGIVSVAIGIVHTNGFFSLEYAYDMSHDRWFVERRLSVHKHDIAIAQMAQDFDETLIAVTAQSLRYRRPSRFIILFQIVRIRMK